MPRIIGFTNGRQTNPSGGTVLADTGPLPYIDEEFFVYVIARASVNTQCALQHRDSSNTSNISVVEFDVPANTTVSFVLPFSAKRDERLRIVTVGGITGDVTAHIRYDVRLQWMH